MPQIALGKAGRIGGASGTLICAGEVASLGFSGCNACGGPTRPILLLTGDQHGVQLQVDSPVCVYMFCLWASFLDTPTTVKFVCAQLASAQDTLFELVVWEFQPLVLVAEPPFLQPIQLKG